MRKFLRPSVFKGISGGVTLVATVVGLLLALGVIDPVGKTEDALASAATKTIDAGSSKVKLDVALDAGDQGKLAFTADGAFDYRTNKGTLTYDYSGTPGAEQATAVPAILTPTAIYYNFSGGTTAPWVRMTPADLAKALGTEADDVRDALTQTTDPSQTLEALKTSGDVEKRGEERLFGTNTTRYEGQVDPAKLDSGSAGSPPFEVKVWVDDSDLVRKIDLSARISEGGESGTLKVTQDLFGFGVPVDAKVPPPNQVISADEFQQQQQQQQLQPSQ